MIDMPLQNVVVALFLLFPPATSLAYFAASRDKGIGVRLATSAHGLILVACLAFSSLARSLTAGPIGGTGELSNMYPLATLILHAPFFLFLSSVYYSFVRYKGPLAIHLLQLVQIPIAIVFWFLGIYWIGHGTI